MLVVAPTQRYTSATPGTLVATPTAPEGRQSDTHGEPRHARAPAPATSDRPRCGEPPPERVLEFRGQATNPEDSQPCYLGPYAGEFQSGTISLFRPTGGREPH